MNVTITTNKPCASLKLELRSKNLCCPSILCHDPAKGDSPLLQPVPQRRITCHCSAFGGMRMFPTGRSLSPKSHGGYLLLLGTEPRTAIGTTCLPFFPRLESCDDTFLSECYRKYTFVYLHDRSRFNTHQTIAHGPQVKKNSIIHERTRHKSYHQWLISTIMVSTRPPMVWPCCNMGLSLTPEANLIP